MIAFCAASRTLDAAFCPLALATVQKRLILGRPPIIADFETRTNAYFTDPAQHRGARQIDPPFA